MKREVKFSLVYRDMWQSSGKYVPRKDQLEQIAPLIIDMGCFDRVETNGGAAEQVNLLYGENPNPSVRAFTAALHKGGIECHMLDRALNALRMNPVPADVRQLMYKVKKAQGVDITRIFCGLNDVRNIIPSVQWANEAGMISQAAMSITYSQVHTAEYYMHIADQLIEAGAKEIALKDMAGVGRPVSLGRIVEHIKKNHPEIKVQYHGHTTPGLSMASMLEVCKAGCDYVDVAMEPLSWGTVHPDVISVQAMLKDAGFLVKDIDMKTYMAARAMTQSFIDDFLGYWIDPRNRYINSLLVGCGLPGGMMGSLMADLKPVHAAINMNREKQGLPALSEDEMLPVCRQYGVSLIPYSPLAGGHLSHRGWESGTARSNTDRNMRNKYDRAKENDLHIIDRVAEVADRLGLSMTEVALAWIMAKGVAAPIVGATKVPHFDAAVRSVDLSLSKEDITYLEEPYKPHEIVGAYAPPKSK